VSDALSAQCAHWAPLPWGEARNKSKALHSFPPVRTLGGEGYKKDIFASSSNEVKLSHKNDASTSSI